MTDEIEEHGIYEAYRRTKVDKAAAWDAIAAKNAEIARLRKGIQNYLDGNYGRHIPRKVDTCQHNKFGWEACENCIDEYFAKLLGCDQ
jgi:hypothetical protein